LNKSIKKGQLKLSLSISLISAVVLTIMVLIIFLPIKYKTLSVLSEDAKLIRDNYHQYVNSNEGLVEEPARSFFVGLIDDNGNVTLDNKGVSFINEEKEEELIYKLSKKNSNEGTYNNFYYLKNDLNNIQEIFVFNASAELENVNSVLTYISSVAVLVWILLSVSSVFIAKKAYKYYENLYNKEKNFITNASHELKTPLTVIQTNLEVMEMEDENNKWIESSKEQVKTLSNLISQLINLSKAEELENKKSQKNIFDLSASFKEIFSQYESQIITRKIKYNLNIPASILITADEPQVYKLFSILLDNMMKYTPQGGTIEITFTESKNKVSLSFYNSSNHITNETISKIFDRFYTGDASHQKDVSGHGIGLSIANEIVINSKGKIKAYTKDEQSLTIDVILPKK